MQQFRQTQHRSVEKDNSGKEIAELRKQNKILERKNKRLLKELSKAVDVRHGFEADEPEPAEEPKADTDVGCPRCDNPLQELHLSTMTGQKHFLVCKTCAYRAVV